MKLQYRVFDTFNTYNITLYHDGKIFKSYKVYKSNDEAFEEVER